MMRRLGTRAGRPECDGGRSCVASRRLKLTSGGQLLRHQRKISYGLSGRRLTYVICDLTLTYMEKTQVLLPKEELQELRQAAARSGRSVADLIREAIRKVVLRPRSTGPVALWDGEPKRASLEHDSIHDEP